MKTTLYLLTAMLLFGIMANGFTPKIKAKNTILVQAIENNADIIIGCKPITELDKVNAYMNSAGGNQKIKFAWGNPSEGGEAYLYALILKW